MIVKTKKILIDSKLECASGEALESFELMTDFYGELNKKKDNAVLVCHAFSGSHHAAGKRGDSVGWWDEFIGCLLYTSPSPRDRTRSRMPSSA